MARVTQHDIAKVMGVSVMTVSNAFNRPDQLSADLRSRVLERAAKMGYTGPDAIARQLRSGRTNTFAVAFEEKLSYAFSDPFAVGFLSGEQELLTSSSDKGLVGPTWSDVSAKRPDELLREAFANGPRWPKQGAQAAQAAPPLPPLYPP